MSTFVIAEAGSTHCGILDNAYRLIDKAVEADCDAVKFQLFNDKLYVEDTPDFGGYRNINKLISSLVLPRDWVPKLKDRCDKNGIEFMATPFDEEAVQILVDLGVSRLKIAAFESSDTRFLRLCGRTQLPLIISIGAKALSLPDIYDEINLVNSDPKVCFLHCVSKYPTPPEEASLLEIRALKDICDGRDWEVGYSDHTTDVFTSSLAVALGATVIEKHFTLSKTLDNPDCPHSLDPIELKQMVKVIREAEKRLTYKSDATLESEQIGCSRAIYAKVDIQAGEYLTEDNITTSRPYLGGLHASRFTEVIELGGITEVAIKAGEVVRDVRYKMQH